MMNVTRSYDTTSINVLSYFVEIEQRIQLATVKLVLSEWHVLEPTQL